MQGACKVRKAEYKGNSIEKSTRIKRLGHHNFLNVEKSIFAIGNKFA